MIKENNFSHCTIKETPYRFIRLLLFARSTSIGHAQWPEASSNALLLPAAVPVAYRTETNGMSAGDAALTNSQSSNAFGSFSSVNSESIGWCGSMPSNASDAIGMDVQMQAEVGDDAVAMQVMELIHNELLQPELPEFTEFHAINGSNFMRKLSDATIQSNATTASLPTGTMPFAASGSSRAFEDANALTSYRP